MSSVYVSMTSISVTAKEIISKERLLSRFVVTNATAAPCGGVCNG